MTLQRRKELARSGVPLRRAGLARAAAPARSAALERHTPIAPVSDRRAAQRRERSAIIRVLFPEGTRCARPGCCRYADDVHEPLTRARGGSITDPANMIPLCRECHDEITFRPEKSELGWAYELGLLVHSWDAAAGGGEAA